MLKQENINHRAIIKNIKQDRPSCPSRFKQKTKGTGNVFTVLSSFVATEKDIKLQDRGWKEERIDFRSGVSIH